MTILNAAPDSHAHVQCLITGLTGMVGSHLADYLLENTDWHIHGLIRPRSSLENIEHLIPRINDKDRVFLHYGDLKDYASLERIVCKVWPDYVFHLAAQSYPRTSFDAPIDTLETNVIGTCNLLEVLRHHCDGAIIHCCSSSEVFGRVPKEKVPIDENCSFHPASPYAISKVGTDLLGRHYAEAYGMNIQTTRMFTTTGPRRGDVFVESTFAKQIAMIEAGLIPPVIKTGNLKSLRTWCDVRDVVRALHMLLTVNPVPGNVFNIGGHFSCTVGDMLDVLLLGMESDIKTMIKIETDPDRLRPIDADLQLPSCEKFKKHTGWHPKINFETTMFDLLQYWKNRIKKGGKFLQR